jgi:ABC-type oligopeptide transport system ATPase subunit
MTAETREPLLRVKSLCKHFPVFSRGFLRRPIGVIKACDDVTFDLMPGETLGLVGESGCGKTTTGRAILRAIEPTGGDVWLRVDGRPVHVSNLLPTNSSVCAPPCR